MNELLNICPICGYDKLDEPPYDSFGNPSHEICPCCGFEYGFDDGSEEYSFEKYRKEWINSGYAWWSKYTAMKSDWGEKIAQKQLENIKLVKYKER